MDALVTKKELRVKVEALCGIGIYSTANLKASGQYRMSIPWHGGYRNGTFANVDPKVWRTCDLKRDGLISQLERAFPRLKGHISAGYHIGSGIYLSLRVDNAVLA
jgi:hypothetical protein